VTPLLVLLPLLTMLDRRLQMATIRSLNALLSGQLQELRPAAGDGYTTLEKTRAFIEENRPPKLTMEAALRMVG